MSVTSTISCDKCGNQIFKDELYLAAGVYGVDLHLNCLKLMSADELIVILNLDDMKVMMYEGWTNAVKANSYFRNEYVTR